MKIQQHSSGSKQTLNESRLVPTVPDKKKSFPPNPLRHLPSHSATCPPAPTQLPQRRPHTRRTRSPCRASLPPSPASWGGGSGSGDDTATREPPANEMRMRKKMPLHDGQYRTLRIFVWREKWGTMEKNGMKRRVGGRRGGNKMTHQWLRSCSIQWTTSRSRRRGERIGRSLAFSCSSIGSSCRCVKWCVSAYNWRKKERREGRAGREGT